MNSFWKKVTRLFGSFSKIDQIEEIDFLSKE